MAKKHIFNRTINAVTGGSNKDFPPIPDGKTIVLKNFGAIDINNGDNVSSVYRLLWGSGSTFQLLRIISITGDTKELPMKRPLRGDGVKHLRVRSINGSATAKDLVFWIDRDEG